VKIRITNIALAVMLVATAGRCVDFDTALAQARETAQRHRYEETIQLLLPFSSSDDPEIRYIAAAEIGRAYFHLARYEPANRAFREAVALHPERAETAIYLEASSYLTGDSKQAFLIFEELLRSGAHDLYLAVTLPGTRRFLAEPEVQAILARYAVPLEVDVREAVTMGVRLGESHDAVVKSLGAPADGPSAGALTGEAGPAVIWAYDFDDQQKLSGVSLFAGNLLEYTPYRLGFASGIDWTATPAAAIAAWGLPSSIRPGDDDNLTITWGFETHHLTVLFGAPGAVRPLDFPEGAAMIRMVRLQTGPAPP
jgi:tetratricopeptide (TPR) repeat protein